mgnify:CR=1 FL=1
MRSVFPLALALALCLGPTEAPAKSPERFYIVLAKSEAAGAVPSTLLSATDAALATVLKKNARFMTKLSNAPDPATDPEAFKKHLAKERLGAFALRAKIERFHRAQEPAKNGKSGHVLRLGVELTLLGESIPDQTLAMSGQVHATIDLEIGKKVRPRDEAAATQEVLGAHPNGGAAPEAIRVNERLRELTRFACSEVYLLLRWQHPL